MQTYGEVISRRHFLASVVAGAAATTQVALAANGHIPVALQLYSIREDCTRDLAGTLAAVAKMGYDSVEFAGYYGHTAKEVRAFLDEVHLKAISSHNNIKLLLGDELEKTIEFNRILGNSRLMVASLPESTTIQKWYDYAKQFNEIAEKLQPHQMRVGFHNHARELDMVEGKRPYDVFLDNTGKEVIMQMDLAHYPEHNLKPEDYMKRYPGRARTVHLKDYAPDGRLVLLGDGVMDWKSVFQAAESVGGIEAYIIEQEKYPEPLTPQQCAARCFENFRRLHG